MNLHFLQRIHLAPVNSWLQDLKQALGIVVLLIIVILHVSLSFNREYRECLSCLEENFIFISPDNVCHFVVENGGHF